jgi:hypothetical protein
MLRHKLAQVTLSSHSPLSLQVKSKVKRQKKKEEEEEKKRLCKKTQRSPVKTGNRERVPSHY